MPTHTERRSIHSQNAGVPQDEAQVITAVDGVARTRPRSNGNT
jgi:hypothetical protein